MPLSRICPECHLRTAERICPADGYSTVEAARYDSWSSGALLGRVFSGRYRVEELIGEGGMGAVYRARQLSVNRAVALKILRPEYAANLDQVRRFQTEARAASALDHPHTIRVFDFGQSDDGALFLVTELLEGEPLSELIRRSGPLDPWRAARIVVQILKSLSEAHASGIVHRDLKPENIFLNRVHGEGDFAKVLDFGIAKVGPHREGRKGITVTGTVVGTPLYMAPEQARGLPVGTSADLYSIGVILYEMVQGEPPFTGDSPMQVMMAHIQSRPPKLDLSLSAPSLGELESIIDWCLNKDPGERPISADALRIRLEAFLGQRGSSSPSISRVGPAVGPSSDAADAMAPTMDVDAAAPTRPQSRGRDTITPAAVTFEAIQAVHGGRRRAAVWAGAIALAVVVGLGFLALRQPADHLVSDAAKSRVRGAATLEAPALEPGEPSSVVMTGAAAAVARSPEEAERQLRREQLEDLPSRPVSKRPIRKTTPPPELRVEKK